jgi:hypothetical protein
MPNAHLLLSPAVSKALLIMISIANNKIVSTMNHILLSSHIPNLSHIYSLIYFLIYHLAII